MEDSDIKRVSQVWSLCCLLPGTGPAWKESTYLSMQSRGIIKLWSFRGREEEKNTHKCAGLCFSWTFKIIFSPTQRLVTEANDTISGKEVRWMEMIFGEKERRKGADIYFSACLAHLSLSLGLNIQMKELGKIQVLESSLRPVGALSPPSGQCGFSISVRWSRGADFATAWSPRAPTLQEAHFSQRPPWNDFPHIFPDSNEKEKAKGLMKACS